MKFGKIPILVSALLAFGVTLAVSSHHLGSLSMWNDEAHTTVVSRTIPKDGVPLADDGRNFMIDFDSCSKPPINRASGKIFIAALYDPWLQAYVAAASSSIFGGSDAGFRFLFLAIACLSLFPLTSLVKHNLGTEDENDSCFKRDWILPWIVAIILLSPQIVLFNRNARYYSILTFEYSVLLWILFGTSMAKARGPLLTAVFVALFHTHPLCAVGIAASAWMCTRRTTIPILVGAGSWILWYVALGTSHSTSWWVFSWAAFSGGVFASFRDLDFIGILPVVMIPLAYYFRKTVKRPIIVFVLLNLLLQILMNSVFLGTETVRHLSNLRYSAHLLVGVEIAILIGVILVWKQGRRRWLGPLFLVIYFFTNLMTVSFGLSKVGGASWFGPSELIPRFSWWKPVYEEIFSDLPDPLRELYVNLRNRVSYDQTLRVFPDFMGPSFLHYLGDQALINYPIDSNQADVPVCMKDIEDEIGVARFTHLVSSPQYLFIFGRINEAPAGYRKTEITFGRTYLDGSRPELTRHEFLMNTGKSVTTLLEKTAAEPAKP